MTLQLFLFFVLSSARWKTKGPSEVVWCRKKKKMILWKLWTREKVWRATTPTYLCHVVFFFFHKYNFFFFQFLSLDPKNYTWLNDIYIPNATAVYIIRSLNTRSKHNCFHCNRRLVSLFFFFFSGQQLENWRNEWSDEEPHCHYIFLRTVILTPICIDWDFLAPRLLSSSYTGFFFVMYIC